MNQIPALTLKPLSNTRWKSRIDALKALRFNMEKIYDALYLIFSNNKYDSDTSKIASSLMSKLKSFKFICSVVTWYNILAKINIVSKSLQKSDVILSEAVKMLDQVRKDLATNRTDTAFEQLLLDSTSIAEELECETEFSQNARPCPRKRHFNYETADEPILDPKQNFEVNFYYYLFGTAIVKVNDRFELLIEHNNNFSFLENIENWRKSEAGQKNTMSQLATEINLWK
ncbi:hypothetical protein ILUMI_15930 [Ignelater luminosus]|uniref:Uncharacterized protein n=1 Tax=Ignelater luminosus TaxID=2038154 RepID=A0A8K0CTV4_IGNLU|nr:hypothetical protein ILUMI_15930 [Ignelater luminosus]